MDLLEGFLFGPNSLGENESLAIQPTTKNRADEIERCKKFILKMVKDKQSNRQWPEFKSILQVFEAARQLAPSLAPLG